MPLSLGIGAGVGLLQNKLAQPERNKQRMLAAQTAAYSPWTGMKAENPAADPSALSAGMQGAMGGAAMGQNMNAANAANQAQGAQANYYNALANKASGGAPSGQ